MAKKDTTLRNSIIGSVASALIVAAILYFVPSVWAGFKTAAARLWFAITYPVSLPVWSLVLIALALLPTVVWIFKALAVDSKKTWRDYTKDTFQGMVWRWRYFSQSDGCRNVWCYCPSDDTALVYSTPGIYGSNQIQFQCETCGRTFGPFDGDKDYIIASIERQIDRKIRNNEWKAIVGVDVENDVS